MFKKNLVIAVILALWFGFWFWQPVNLLSADLGRHLTNGKIILTEPQNFSGLLKNNFYSYATPNAPFINHHWLTGVIFFLIYSLAGFTGLSVFHLVINVTTFLLFFRLTVQKSNFAATTLVALFLIPLLAGRTEIRPEIFTYLFTALFMAILSGVSSGARSPRFLFALIPIQILWVNLHIYFFLGPFLIAIFWLESIIKKNNATKKYLFLILLGVIPATLINPNGLAGALFPLFIYSNYDFLTYENQSVAMFDARNITFANLLIFKLAVIAILSLLALQLTKKQRNISGAEFALTLIFGCWAYLAIRNLTLFGYFALLTLGSLITDNFDLKLGSNLFNSAKKFLLWCLVVFGATLFLTRSRAWSLATESGLGLKKTNLAAAEFILNNNITGPMFNDFDIGGYATFFLFPKIPPFVDNRPEAYPPNFLQNVYTNIQRDESVWANYSNLYKFNFLLLSRQDKNIFTVSFIARRATDPNWATVYRDENVVVFLRRDQKNLTTIQKYESLYNK